MNVMKHYWPLCLAITGAYFERSRTVEITEDVWYNEELDDYLVDLPETFEEFVENCNVCFSHEADIPVEQLYEEYVYKKNYIAERIRWQDLLEKEVF